MVHRPARRGSRSGFIVRTTTCIHHGDRKDTAHPFAPMNSTLGKFRGKIRRRRAEADALFEFRRRRNCFPPAERVSHPPRAAARFLPEFSDSLDFSLFLSLHQGKERKTTRIGPAGVRCNHGKLNAAPPGLMCTLCVARNPTAAAVGWRVPPASRARRKNSSLHPPRG